MIKTEKDIKQEIKDALRWEPILRESDITVHINDGTVVLDGTVNTAVKKIKAEEVARRVAHLQSVVNDIEVKRKGIKGGKHKENDDKLLEHDVKEAIRWHADINRNWIKVTVNEGWVTIEGTVPHAEQRDRLRQIAADIPGVMGVANLIKVAYHEESEEYFEEEEQENRTEENETEMKRRSNNKPEEMTRNEERTERENRRDRLKRRQERIERRVLRRREEREDFRRDFRKEKHQEENRDRKQRFTGLRRTARTAGKLLKAVKNFYRKIRE